MATTTNTLNGIVFNEFALSHSKPGAVDINNIGGISASDNYLELYNTTMGSVDISGWEVWSTSNNAGTATLRATIDPSTTIAADGYFVLTDPLPIGGDFTNIPSPAQELDSALNFNTQSTYALYNPGTNTYLLTKAELAFASETTMIAGLEAAHSGATNAAAGVDIYPGSTGSTFASVERITDGDAMFQSGPMTPGADNLCFAAGTLITTATGETTVETLQIGDHLRTADGATTQVKWIGRQTVLKAFAREKAQMVRIAKGALGNHSDLYVTAAHGMVFYPSSSEAVRTFNNNGYVINASALINDTTITWVPLDQTAERYTVYHVETEAHDVIRANGAPSETYLDLPGRAAFDNYQEYLDLYGTEQTIAENPMPRITSARLLPAQLQASLRKSA